jgi:hydrogenase expression/formation protein HypE
MPAREDVRGACEILDSDPLYLAKGGKFIALVPDHEVERALSIMSSHPFGAGASVIGGLADSQATVV